MLDKQTIRIATWNLKWAKPNTDRSNKCLKKLIDLNPHIVCLTEAFEDSLKPVFDFTAFSTEDTGYPIRPGRRKVVIGSKWPLSQVDQIGSTSLPTGRFVSASVNGGVAIELIGVCIPWKAAHVNDGRKDRGWWEDHQRFLSALNEVDRFNEPSSNAITFGDYNQRISGKYARKDVHEQMKETFSHYEIATGDLQDADGKSSIDHIAIRGVYDVVDRGVISRFEASGTEISDHFGVWCDLSFE